MVSRTDIPPLRVILVGSSPLEQRLRRDAGIELIRARGALDAIGELSLSDTAPELEQVVVLAPEVIAQEELDDLISAMRRVDERVRVLGVRSPATDATPVQQPRGCGALCGWIGEEATGAELRASLAPAPQTSADPAPSSAPATSSARVESVAPIEAVEMDAFTDEGILAALLSGADIIGPCLDHLRRRFRPDEIRFQWVETAGGGGGSGGAGAGAPPVAPIMENAQRVAVEHRQRLFAWIEGPSGRAQELMRAARWLGHWLAVRDQHSQLRSAAFTDPLTGAWNRRYLDRFLPMAIDRAREKRHDVTLLLFDIDNFKHYNDNYGHPAGDEILIETVRLLNSVIRPTDRVTRIGGDEFAVVFDNPEGPRDPSSHHPASIFEIARRFQRQINDHQFPKLGEKACGSLTISGGLATFPWDAADATLLIDRADRLILDSKRAGKNVICLGPGARQALGGPGEPLPPDSRGGLRS